MSADNQFQSLEAQDAREYWTHEAREFTPWLVEAIEADETSDLEDALGIDLEVVDVERAVGRYKIDILARTIEGDRKIVIENQLETSDHDHLGKCITYAAGVDADVIVWIAPVFRDEHREAFAWLNTHATRDVDLFALKLEVWTIDDSPPAVRLNPIESPSAWQERVQSSGADYSDRQETYLEFWTRFTDRIKEESTPLRARKPSYNHYYSNPIGRAEYDLSFLFDKQEGMLRTQLNIHDDEDAYWALLKQKTEIEAELDTALLWEEPRETRTGRMRSNVTATRPGELSESDRWDAYQTWFMQMGEQFHEVFKDRISAL
jgi:hypothetical protein